MKHHCPMCGEQWNEDVCEFCGWREGKPVRYNFRDKRKTGEGAMKGWATRRRKAADRKAALERLTEVAESMTGEMVVRSRVEGCPALLAVHVEGTTIINWRDRITSALRILEGN